jgi:hypothetical protein
MQKGEEAEDRTCGTGRPSAVGHVGISHCRGRNPPYFHVNHRIKQLH